MPPDDPYEMYLRELETIEPLPQAEETELFRRAADGELAKKRLIESHLGLVVKIANQYSPQGAPRLEIVEHGNLGLLSAVDSFAQKPSGDFAPYAEVRIKAEIEKFLKNRDRKV